MIPRLVETLRGFVRIRPVRLPHLAVLAAPPQCPSCGTRVRRGPAFCLPCARRVGRSWRSERPVRRCVGLPDGTRFRVRAAAPLEGRWGRAVRAYKSDPEPSLGRLLAEPLAAVCRRRLRRDAGPGGLLVPVPMASVRRRERGANPAERLAFILGAATGLPVETGLLRRARYRRPLRGLGARARRAEVEGAFALVPAGGNRSNDIWLVDDVHTTGATLAAAAVPLVAAGFRVRGAWVLARTPRRSRGDAGVERRRAARGAP